MIDIEEFISIGFLTFIILFDWSVLKSNQNMLYRHFPIIVNVINLTIVFLRLNMIDKGSDKTEDGIRWCGFY